MAASTFHKQVVPNAGDHDAHLDGALIGSFPTADQAQAEVDRVTYEHAIREEAARALTPFGVIGGPRPDSDVTDAELEAAHRDFCAFFKDSPKVLERADRALDVAKNRERFTIREDGSVTAQGSKRYRVSDEGCTCRDFFVRQVTHAGMCKHSIARELYRLAQAKHISPNAPVAAADMEADTMAFVSVNTRALARALIGVSGAIEFGYTETVRFTIVGSVVTIAVEDRQERIEGTDGTGGADGRHTLNLPADQFIPLWDVFRPVARTCGDTITIFLDYASATIVLSSGAWGVEISATPS